MQNRGLKIVGAIAAVVILIAILIPFLINADTFRPRLEEELSTALARKVTLGHITFSPFTGNLVANDLSIADDPAFSTAPFVRAKELAVGVEMGPLIFHKDVRVTRLTVDTPAIQLIQNASGRWNFSSIGAAGGGHPVKSSSGLPAFDIGKLKITNGSATVSSLPATARPFVYSNVNLEATQFSLTNSFPFEVTASLPAQGTLKLTGTAGPISAKDASDTPFQADLALRHFDPVAAGVIEGNKGISMVADVDAHSTSNGKTLSNTGKITASKLQLARTGSPAPQPVNIDYKVSSDLDARTGQVTDLAIHSGSVAAHVTGTFRFTPQAVLLDLHLTAPNLPVDPVEQLLPAFGVRVPAGSQLRGGTITANLAVAGPATAATISGPVQIDNTNLAGFDLGARIQGLNALSGTAGTRGGTTIQTLRAVVNSSPQGTQLTNIYGNLPQLGTATGEGTVSPAGALNFRMVATLTSSNATGALANQAVNTVTNILGGFLHPNAKPSTATNHGIPLLITGTSTNPSIRADIGTMLR